MRKRTKVLLFTAGVLVVILAVAREVGEPTYKGVALSEWLEGYQQRLWLGHPHGQWPVLPPDGSEPAGAREASDAVRHIGAKALPVLVDWMSFRPSPLKAKLEGFADKAPRWLQSRWLERSLGSRNALHRLDLALSGFAILGSNAAPAIPKLMETASDPTAPGCRRAATALIRIGPPALPALTNGLIPALLRNLKSSDTEVAGHCALMLGDIALQPEAVTPALLATLNHPSPFVRGCAAASLGKYNEAAGPAVSRLTNLPGLGLPR